MSSNSITSLRKTFLHALPASTIDEFAAFFQFRGTTTEEKIDRIARAPAANVVGHILASDIPVNNLKQAARAPGIDLRGMRGAK